MEKDLLSFYDQYELKMEDIKPKIIDTIVEVYGEKNRAIIEDRLNRIYINTYVTLNDLKNYYNFKKDEKKHFWTKKFLNDYMNQNKKDDEIVETDNYNDQEKEILKIFFGWTQLDKFGNLSSFYDNESAQKVENNILEKRCKILSFFGVDITPENYYEVIEKKEVQPILNDIKNAYELSKKYLAEFDKDVEELKKLENSISKLNEIEKKIRLDYKIEYFKEILPFMNEEEQDNANKILQNLKDIQSEYNFDKKVDKNTIYCNYDFLISAFKSEYDEKINDDSFNSQNIRNKRIKYFKSYGLNLGDDYSEYEKNAEAQKLWPSKERVEKIVEINEKNNTKCQNEVLRRTSTYSKCKENLDKLELKCGEEFNFDFMKNNVVCIVPNMIQTSDGNYENINVLHIKGISSFDYYRDTVMIHEILHVVELSISEIVDKEIKLKSGFDYFSINIGEEVVGEDEKYEHIVRNYEILSENIHQEIAIVITNILHDKGIYLIDNPKKSKTRGGTSYEQVTSLTSEFICKFGKDLKEGMINSDMNYIYEKLGKENFDKYNEIVNQYRKLPYYKMMSELREKKNGGQDTELTLKFEELKLQARNIIEKMKIHIKENNQKVEDSKDERDT